MTMNDCSDRDAWCCYIDPETKEECAEKPLWIINNDRFIYQSTDSCTKHVGALLNLEKVPIPGTNPTQFEFPDNTNLFFNIHLIEYDETQIEREGTKGKVIL